MPIDGPGGIYKNGAPDGSRPGVFLANVKKPTNKYDLFLFTLVTFKTDILSI